MRQKYKTKHMIENKFSVSLCRRIIMIICLLLIPFYCMSSIWSYFASMKTKINSFTIATPYVVKFDANGGTGTMQDQIMYTNHDAQLSLNTFTSAGYSFAGWNTEEDGTGTSYSDGQTVRNLTDQSEITLYAQWGEFEYTVIFNANNGSGDTSTQTFVANVSQNLAENEFEKEGYTFDSWNTEEDGSGTSYEDEELVNNLTDVEDGEVNLYAQWTPNTYTVEFNANGGTGTMLPQEFTYDTAQNLSTNTFTKENNSFWHWNTKADGSGIAYEDEEEVINLTSVNEDTVTLYAIYAKDRYVHNGDVVFTGSNYIDTGVNLFSAENINRNFEVSFEITSRDTATSLATMMGAMDESNTSVYPGLVYRIRNGSEDQFGANATRSAKVESNYQRRDISKVTLKRLNGILYVNFNDTEDTPILDMTGLTTPFDVPVTFGAGLNASKQPQRYFTGTLSNLYVLVTDAGGVINFDANGGTGTMASQVVLTNAQTKINKNTFEKTDYYLTGWNTEPDGSGTSYSDEGLISLAATQGETVTLYAQWDRYTYTIKYDANGGTGTMQDQDFESGIPENLTTNAFTRNGNTFIKWNTKQDGTGIDLYDGDEILNLGTYEGEEITLYAFWSNIYEYYDDVVFDGSSIYINTGIELFNSENLDKDFEIAFEIKNLSYVNNIATLINAMDESNTTDYPGIAFRQSNASQNQILVNDTTSNKKTVNYPAGNNKIRIRRINGIIYMSIDDGEDTKILDMSSRTDTFDTPVTIGAGLNGSGNPQRYITGTLSNISVVVGDDHGLVKFNANGGTGTMDDQVMYANREYKLKPNEFRYTGYMFNGWNTEADGSGISYSDEDDIQVMASEQEIVTLYAQWEPYSYTIRYNANGGTGTMSDQELDSGVAENLTNNAFSRSGNTFLKWNTRQDGTGKDYFDGESVIDVGDYDGQIVTLYAMWSNIFEYNGDVVFDGSTNYINTGIQLFNAENADKDFEISFEIIQRNTSTKNASLVAAMDESGMPYPGIVYRINNNTNDEFAANATTQNPAISYNRADVSKVTIKRIDGILYININDEGDTEILDMSTSYRKFNVPVLFGAGLDGNGNPWRYFKGTLSNIHVIMYEQ